MRLIRLILVVFLVAFSSVVMAQEPIPISDLHYNDDIGLPLLFEEIVTIQGVVTVPSGVFNTSRTDVYIQDETGGMNLFTFNPVATYNAGDEVRVTGTVIAYNGFTEVQPISVELISTGNTEPQPLLLTCRELYNSYDYGTNFEANEARLVRLNNVTWDSGNYALTDDTGTAMMYIPPSTGIPTPEGEFNVVGVVKQYDDAGEEGPWYLGYEVLPRYISDITYGSGPQFVSYPVQTDVAVGGATITWTTDIECETVLEYGTTAAYEMEPIRLANSTTNHEVVLEGLSSATVYYCRAVAGNDSEAVNSPPITVVAPSENSSGQIDVYFSQSVDTAYSAGIDAVQTNIAQRMVDLIDAATTSVDFCFFAFTHEDVADALIGAHDRGVAVQVIYEVFDPVINELIVAGIDVRTDPDEEHENTHNKFTVFDARDDDETNDMVWTGSWNASYNGTNLNAENVVVVHDAALAAAYTIEFDEMWGGVFSNNKVDNTPHLFLIGGNNVEQYMSPSDDVPDKLVNLIGTADTDILFAIYNFTDGVIADAVTSRFNAGAALRGVFDAEAADYTSSQYQPLLDLGADVIRDNVEQGGADQLMHHKYLLADPLPEGSDPTVVTGSYNWTFTASAYKDENILIIHDATVANIFFQEWMARYHEGGGTWDFEMPEQLEAVFSWDPMAPFVDDVITFTDASTGEVTGWAWDFGDGIGTSTDQNPTYSFDAAGTYSVTLEVTDGVDTSSVSHEITVIDEPVSEAPVYVAAAGAAAGVGSFWATDVTINNRGIEPLTYSIQFLERNKNNSDPETVGPFTLDANTSAAYPDVVTDLFEFVGFGALAVVVSDPESALVMSRTFNTFSDGTNEGTFGQGLPGVAEADLIPADTTVRLVLLSEDESFRTNIGFLNGTGSAIHMLAEFFTADGTSLGQSEVNVAPYGNTQWNRAFNRVTNDDVTGGFVDVWTDTVDGMFYTYGSVAGEDAFSDPTTILPQTTGGVAKNAGPVYIAAAGAAAGVGSFWGTDVTVNNAGAEELSYSFQFLERNVNNTDPETRGPFTLGANMSMAYPDIVTNLFEIEGFGALAVEVNDPDSTVVMSRTFNTFSDGTNEGTFGQGIPGVTEADLIPANTKVRLIHLFEDADFRTNIGFLNGTDTNIRIMAEFFAADGTSLGESAVNVAPFGNTQWNRAFNRVTENDVTGGFVDVWTETSGALFYTYGSVAGEDAFSDPTTILPQ